MSKEDSSTQATARLDGGSFRYVDRLVRNSLLPLLVHTFVLVVSLVVGDAVLHWQHSNIPIQIGRGLVLLPMWWVGALALRIVPGWGTSPVEQLRRIEVLLAGVFAIIALGLFVRREPQTVSRITVLVSYATATALLPLAHVWCKRLLLRMGIWGVPIVVYGNDETANYAVRAMLDEPGMGYHPIGVFDDEAALGERIHGIPVIGRLDNWTPRAPFAILAAPSMSREQMVAMLDGPLSRYRRVIVLPDLFEAPSLWVKPRDFMGVLGLEIASNLLNPFARVAKYWGERLLVLLTLPVWLPLLFLLALLIRIEDGEFPFFLQERVGYKGRLFRVMKFRTMRPDAEAILARRIQEDEELRAEWEAHCKLKNDPRITRIGRLLRSTSLDEVPQLFNVLAGEMSLVGPRPLPRYHHERLPEKVRGLRERVLPGITGLWQVSGRSEAGNAGIERWDTYYVRNWSIWLDLVILARTVGAVLRGRGAY